MVIMLCKMFGCLPSALDDEPAEVMRLVSIYQAGHKQEEVE